MVSCAGITRSSKGNGMHTFNTRGTCSRQINFDIVDGNVHNVSFVGGCDRQSEGYLKAHRGQARRLGRFCS